MSQPPARLAIKCAQLQLGEVPPVSAFRDHGDHRDQGPLGEQLAWYASSELLGVAGESCWAPMAHVVGTIAAIVSGQRPPHRQRGPGDFATVHASGRAKELNTRRLPFGSPTRFDGCRGRGHAVANGYHH
jgi:hypothetical protein